MSISNDYLNMTYLENSAIAPKRPDERVFVTRAEISPSMQFKCIKCSVLGVALCTLGAFDIAISIAKGNFWQAYQPNPEGPFVTEVADYVIFCSGISCFMSGALAFRAAMISGDSHCFNHAMTISSITTSVLGLLVSDYFTK